MFVGILRLARDIVIRKHQTEAAILISGAWKTQVIYDPLYDQSLTSSGSQVDVSLFLYLHQRDELRAPTAFDSEP